MQFLSSYRLFRVCLTCAVIVAWLASVGAHRAWAQEYPSRPIRIICAYTPGGANDVMARIVAQKLTESLGQPVIVENRPGAGGIIGAALAAKSPPDGYTLFMMALAHAAHQSLYKSLPFNVEKDFAPITGVAVVPLILVVGPATPLRSLEDFIAYVKTRPGELHYGSAGNGTSQHLAMELLKSQAGLDLIHVPYKGIPEALIDVIGGRLIAAFAPTPSVLAHMQSKKLRALAVGSAKRFALVPDLPTIEESGLIGYSADTWHGLTAPARTPQAILAKLSAEVTKILNRKDIRAEIAKQGAEAAPLTPPQFAAFIRAEVEKYAKVVKAANIRLD